MRRLSQIQRWSLPAILESQFIEIAKIYFLFCKFFDLVFQVNAINFISKTTQYRIYLITAAIAGYLLSVTTRHFRRYSVILSITLQHWHNKVGLAAIFFQIGTLHFTSCSTICVLPQMSLPSECQCYFREIPTPTHGAGNPNKFSHAVITNHAFLSAPVPMPVVH